MAGEGIEWENALALALVKVLNRYSQRKGVSCRSIFELMNGKSVIFLKKDVTSNKGDEEWSQFELW